MDIDYEETYNNFLLKKENSYDDKAKSKMYVNGVFTNDFIHAPLVDGNNYRAEFTSKQYDESKDTDFMPPEL